MKKAKDYSRAKQVYFNPEIKLCPHCNQPLKQSHIAWQKPQTIYRSIEAEMLSLKYYQFSLDVIAKVGRLYFKEHQTIDEITQTLKKLHISRSEINLLCQAYLA